MGLSLADNQFFLLERYRQLAVEGLVHQPEALALRDEILNKDLDNAKLTHYKVAVIEFEAYSEEMGQDRYAAEAAIAPLLTYIIKHGSKDQDNLWRLNMIISQVFLDEDNLAVALEYAKQALDKAPSTMHPQLATAIQNMESKI